MNSHHANLVFADSLSDAALPASYKTASADVVHFAADRFSIDDARELSRLAELRPFEPGANRVFILIAKDIAIEAQNALLKLLEEPPQYVLIYVVVSKTTYLLPTLLSRLSVETPKDAISEVPMYEDFKAFTKSSYAERLSQIALKTKEKDSPWIENILQGCEAFCAQAPLKNAKILETIIFIRSYIGTKGASSKMLLEELALLMDAK